MIGFDDVATDTARPDRLVGRARPDPDPDPDQATGPIARGSTIVTAWNNNGHTGTFVLVSAGALGGTFEGSGPVFRP